MNEVLITGDSWTSAVFTKAFQKRNQKTKTLQLPPPVQPVPPLIPVSIGNGDPKERVTLTMGKKLADAIWDISEKNFKKTKEIFNPSDFKIQSDKLELESALKKFPITIFLSEIEALSRYPFLADKMIPVTLSSFLFTAKPECPDFSFKLFNAGADFAVREKNKLLLGSYRNLFEDHAVGIHKVPDPKTLEGVSKFFGDMGWIDPKESAKAFLSLETVTCDGLALVGTIPEQPNVYFVGGFTGRTANFIFEVADQVAESVLGNGSLEGLSCFSMKRFL